MLYYIHHISLFFFRFFFPFSLFSLSLSNSFLFLIKYTRMKRRYYGIYVYTLTHSHRFLPFNFEKNFENLKREIESIDTHKNQHTEKQHTFFE